MRAIIISTTLPDHLKFASSTPAAVMSAVTLTSVPALDVWKIGESAFFFFQATKYTYMHIKISD